MGLDASNINATSQVLTLGKGLHLVSVTAANPQRVGQDDEILLPAIHVGEGPVARPGQVEIMPGPRGNSAWLVEAGDMLVVKVNHGRALVLVTTMRIAPAPAISIEITRLDRVSAGQLGAPAPVVNVLAAPAPTSALVPPAPPPPLKTASGRQALDVQLDLHVANRGDVSYVNNFWAGALGERAPIEAFAISPLSGLAPEQIEYLGVTESGRETGWLAGGELCGSRGAADALVGFAIRVRPGAAADFECEYRGAFSSGRIVGPLRNGAPCRSDPGDQLEAIQLFILPRIPRPSTDEALVPEASELVATNAEAPIAAAASGRKRSGPKFGVFRETAE